MNRLLLCILIIWSLQSCHTTQKMMDSWIGGTKQNLVLRWGPPDRVASDANNGEIYIYDKQSVFYNTVRYNHTMFYINNLNSIYSWRTESGPVPAQQMNVNLYVH